MLPSSYRQFCCCSVCPCPVFCSLFVCSVNLENRGDRYQQFCCRCLSSVFCSLYVSWVKPREQKRPIPTVLLPLSFLFRFLFPLCLTGKTSRTEEAGTGSSGLGRQKHRHGGVCKQTVHEANHPLTTLTASRWCMAVTQPPPNFRGIYNSPTLLLY